MALTLKLTMALAPVLPKVDGIGRVLVCNVHFSSDATPEGAQIRTRQIHQLVSTIETMYAHLQQRVILSGSFNMNAVKNDVDGAQLLMLMWRLGLETAVNTHAHGLADMYARAGFSDNVRDYLFASRALGELVQLSVVDRPVETEAPGARVHLPLLGLLQISSSAGDC
ncbi:hypothetical protein HK105_200278 [Polyrhizophydium stewartii]|uniref:Endonuclease/exonuclease/phosphatase domain-containing protein n=1 Tax=Polyrhizophydium stewartii TaxID=2732419 RepID=A0ABR4NL03_9FUNG